MTKALFDPGFSKCLISFYANIEYIYGSLNSIKNFNQKKTQFSMSYNKIAGLLNKYTGFYMGCMLWGTYLKSLGEEKIENNPFLGQKYDKNVSLAEVNDILEFVEKFKKDTKYHTGKNFDFGEVNTKILNSYTEFVEKNQGFIDTETTDKIELVGHLANLSKEEIDKIEEKIQDVIHTGKLEELREFCDKI